MELILEKLLRSSFHGTKRKKIINDTADMNLIAPTQNQTSYKRKIYHAPNKIKYKSGVCIEPEALSPLFHSF